MRVLPRRWQEGGGVPCPRRLDSPEAPSAGHVPAAEPAARLPGEAGSEVGAFSPLCVSCLAARRGELPVGSHQAFSPAAPSSAAPFAQNQMIVGGGSEGDRCPVSARAAFSGILCWPRPAVGQLRGRAHHTGRAVFGLAGRGAGRQLSAQLYPSCWPRLVVPPSSEQVILSLVKLAGKILRSSLGAGAEQRVLL